MRHSSAHRKLCVKLFSCKIILLIKYSSYTQYAYILVGKNSAWLVDFFFSSCSQLGRQVKKIISDTGDQVPCEYSLLFNHPGAQSTHAQV